MQLPEEFIRYTHALMGDDRWPRFLAALNEAPPVSLRVNPAKVQGNWMVEGGEPVAWCPLGYYLPKRPNFTFDPLLHAGCYYVQEAASMFVDHVLRQYVQQPVLMLDLCAAPGGKSTAARAALPAGSILVSNEPHRQRAQILLENIAKWGADDCIVTNNYPKDYHKSRLQFDVLLCDVPCSGEGMFRKDEGAIAQWSPPYVERCQTLQRDIVSEAWHCLRPGGLLIYSTCTYNTKENEENVKWICEQLEADVLPVATENHWNVTGSLLAGFTAPVYRFIPGLTRSEGLFIAVMRKHGMPLAEKRKPLALDTLLSPRSPLHVIYHGADHEAVADEAALSYTQAMAYLRGEAIVLPPEVTRGTVRVTFCGQPLGYVKNIGSRANNRYPQNWRIKSTHIPLNYEAILRLA